ncbi:hypothetical protein G5I_09210 [Acromyrmex echinatior]|uniref:Uncharacterized protein n=1 Tax=Acromyrmex echinatior TaxID=103372 RepID=F4WTK5_ACREC|nr:hypothetical protein G5I_09210 [Acromyrmex echinatior]
MWRYTLLPHTIASSLAGAFVVDRLYRTVTLPDISSLIVLTEVQHGGIFQSDGACSGTSLLCPPHFQEHWIDSSVRKSEAIRRKKKKDGQKEKEKEREEKKEDQVEDNRQLELAIYKSVTLELSEGRLRRDLTLTRFQIHSVIEAIVTEKSISNETKTKAVSESVNYG